MEESKSVCLGERDAQTHRSASHTQGISPGLGVEHVCGSRRLGGFRWVGHAVLDCARARSQELYRNAASASEGLRVEATHCGDQ
jgi:hypothetical protein